MISYSQTIILEVSASLMIVIARDIARLWLVESIILWLFSCSFSSITLMLSNWLLLRLERRKSTSFSGVWSIPRMLVLGRNVLPECKIWLYTIFLSKIHGTFNLSKSTFFFIIDFSGGRTFTV
jgi:hypothetical protein